MAQRLLGDARESKCDMPIVFGDALECRRLLYWAVLTDIKIDEERGETEYSFKQVRPLRDHFNRELVLRSTGKKIAEGFIRNYAICFTPDFLG
jgi:hypothetical protein